MKHSISFLLCIFALHGGVQVGCLAKVERRCEQDVSCQGAERPSVCFEGTCVLKVCDVGKIQRCYEARCETPNSPNCATPTQTRGVGSCQDGFQVCIKNGSEWSSCIGSQLPRPEICDGKDNNCDGKVDENLNDCACNLGQTRACFTGPIAALYGGNSPCYEGLQTCIKSPSDGTPLWGPCEYQQRPADFPQDAITSCQIRDIDCDGNPDDIGVNCTCAQAGETRKCYPGPASTLRDNVPCAQGTQTCTKSSDGSLQWGSCTGFVLPKPEELQECNGKDDDCDGKIDNRSGTNAPLYRPCGESKDCTVQVCASGSWGLCQKQEVCNNNQDDNCDGKIDEMPCVSLP